MLEARALLYALVVSLLIAVVSGALISLAHLQRQQQTDQFDRERQIHNLNSGIALAMGGLHQQQAPQKIDLYGNQSDWLELRRSQWGFFDVAWARTIPPANLAYSNFSQSPPPSASAYKACLLGNRNNPSLRAALYLCDQVAPLTLAGRTLIRGEARLPSNGIKKGYINGTGFIGNQLIEGKRSKSNSYLPSFDEKRIEALLRHFQMPVEQKLDWPVQIHQSFTDSTQVIAGEVFYLNQINWSGNMIVIARDSIVVSANCQLEDLLLFAPKIVFQDRFEGAVQAFASRELEVGEECQFSYPSVLAILKATEERDRPGLRLGRGSQLGGLLFTYQKNNNRQPIQVKIEEEVLVKGQVFVDGQLELRGAVYGNVSCQSFLLETSSSLYSNYLYNATIDRLSLSEHYVSGMIFSDDIESEVLRWVH